jgi:hypothetical protein
LRGNIVLLPLGAGEKLVNFALITSLPIVVGTVVAAPKIIGFLYGKPEFQHAVPALAALAIGLICISCNMAIGMVFLSSQRDHLIPVQAGLALVFNVGLNPMLIPRFLQVGATCGVARWRKALYGHGSGAILSADQGGAQSRTPVADGVHALRRGRAPHPAFVGRHRGDGALLRHGADDLRAGRRRPPPPPADGSARREGR